MFKIQSITCIYPGSACFGIKLVNDEVKLRMLVEYCPLDYREYYVVFMNLDNQPILSDKYGLMSTVLQEEIIEELQLDEIIELMRIHKLKDFHAITPHALNHFILRNYGGQLDWIEKEKQVDQASNERF